MEHTRRFVHGVVVVATGLVIGCGSTTSSAPSGSAGAAGSAASAPFGYGPNGYGFAGYGGDTGWAGAANGFSGAVGVAGSTAAASCVGVEPPTPANAVMLDSCAAVAQGYEFQVQNPGISYGWVDSTPGAKETHTVTTLDPALCGDTDAYRFTMTGSASTGGNYDFGGMPRDLSAWDGFALWVRAGAGTTASFGIAVWDATTLGNTVINSATGEKACYVPGDDWDLDGVPNLSLPPWPLLCQGWSVNLTVTDQWRFVLLPWSIWSSANERVAAIGIKTSGLSGWQLYLNPCSATDLWIASLGPYRAIAQP